MDLEINRSAICEVMNQMVNGSSATALSEFLGITVNISTPISLELRVKNLLKKNISQHIKSGSGSLFSGSRRGQQRVFKYYDQWDAKRLLEPFRNKYKQPLEQSVQTETPAASPQQRLRQMKFPQQRVQVVLCLRKELSKVSGRKPVKR